MGRKEEEEEGEEKDQDEGNGVVKVVRSRGPQIKPKRKRRTRWVFDWIGLIKLISRFWMQKSPTRFGAWTPRLPGTHPPVCRVGFNMRSGG